VKGGTWSAGTNSVRSLISGNTSAHTQFTNYPDHGVHRAGVNIMSGNNKIQAIVMPI
jgi:hypothetical protein